MRYSAANLTFDYHRIYHLAAVLDGENLFNANDPSFDVDLDDSRVAAISEYQISRIKGSGSLQSGIEVFRMGSLSKVDSTGNFGHCHRPGWDPSDVNGVIFEYDIGCGYF